MDPPVDRYYWKTIKGNSGDAARRRKTKRRLFLIAYAFSAVLVFEAIKHALHVAPGETSTGIRHHQPQRASQLPVSASVAVTTPSLNITSFPMEMAGTAPSLAAKDAEIARLRGEPKVLASQLFAKDKEIARLREESKVLAYQLAAKDNKIARLGKVHAANAGLNTSNHRASYREAALSSKSFPPGCNWTCYFDRNPKLLKHLDRTEEAAISHYVAHGISEGRRCSCEQVAVVSRLREESKAFSTKLARIKNIHANFPRRCEEGTELPADYDSSAPKETVNSHHFHGRKMPKILFQVQVCQYEALDIFRRLAEQYSITRWAATAGSLVGTKCYSSMNPWDDVIDITIHPQHDAALRAIWESGEPTKDYYDERFEGRYLANRTLIMYSLSWYWGFLKLVTTTQKKLLPQVEDISGIDLLLFNPAESRWNNLTGFTEYLGDTTQPLQDVEFGPTRIKQVPDFIVEKYMRTRGWKCLSQGYDTSHHSIETNFG